MRTAFKEQAKAERFPTYKRQLSQPHSETYRANQSHLHTNSLHRSIQNSRQVLDWGCVSCRSHTWLTMDTNEFRSQ